MDFLAPTPPAGKRPAASQPPVLRLLDGAPLPALAPHVARLARALADDRLATRLAQTLGIADWHVANGAAAHFADPGWIEFGCGDAQASVCVELADHPALASVARDAEFRDDDALRDAVAAVLLSSLAPMFESFGLHDVRARAVHRGAPPVDPADSFAASFNLGDKHLTCLFGALDDACLDAVEQCVAGQPVPRADYVDAIRVPGRLRIGARTINIAKLRSLRPGDVLLRVADGTAGNLRGLLRRPVEPFDTHVLWGAPGARQIQAAVRVEENVLTLLGEPTMTYDTENLDSAGADDAVDVSELDLPVKFELDTVSLPVSQLSALRAGYVVELPVAAAEARIRLTSYGQTIGFGELVTVGDHLGVRVIQMSHGNGSV